MESISHFLTAITLVAVLVLGAVGGVHAHARMDHSDGVGTTHPETPCLGHDHRQTASCNAVDPGRSLAMEMTAPCCQNLGTLAWVDAVTGMFGALRIGWSPDQEERFDARRITPDSPPPKSFH